MQFRKFGRTGLNVSRLCLGTMTFGLQTEEDVSRSIMDRAAEAGVNFIDTADVYPLGSTEGVAGRTEEIVGRWLKETPALPQPVHPGDQGGRQDGAVGMGSGRLAQAFAGRY